MVWTSLLLPTEIGAFVIGKKNDVEYRIGCAGSGRWTVSAQTDRGWISGTLELTGDLYAYAVRGDRPKVGKDWKALISS